MQSNEPRGKARPTGFSEHIKGITDTNGHILSNRLDASTTGFVFANPNSDRRPTLVFRNTSIFDNDDAYVMVSITPMYDVDVVCAAFDEAPQNYSVINAREGASNSGTNGAGVAYHALLSLKQAQYYDIYCATNDQVSVVSDKLTVATQFKIQVEIESTSGNSVKLVVKWKIVIQDNTRPLVFCSIYNNSHSSRFIPTLGEHIVDNSGNQAGIVQNQKEISNANQVQLVNIYAGNYTIYCARNFTTENKAAILSEPTNYVIS